MPTITDTKYLPRGYPFRQRGSCVPAAFLIISAVGAGEAVQGYVGPGRDEHTWVEAGGEIIDPTIRQFSWWRAGAQVSREVIKRIPAAEFCEQFQYVIKHPWTDAAAHYRKFVSRDGEAIQGTKARCTTPST